jgi:hypothetical protein
MPRSSSSPLASSSVAVIGLGVVGLSAIRVLFGAGRERIDGTDADLAIAHKAQRLDRRLHLVTLDAALRADIVVIATSVPQRVLAEQVVERGGIAVVNSDDLTETRLICGLGRAAHGAGQPLIVGAAMMPGLSGLLARRLAARMDHTDEIHTFAHGTGGPACARQHHRALGGTATGWHDGEWIERPAGSGRELCWFPDPVGPRDCYRAETSDPELMVRAFPDIDRASARISATRRDRLTSRLPMLRPPHADGGIGGLRVEVRGSRGGERVTDVLGASGRPGVIAGTVAGVMTAALLDGLITATGVVVPGASDLPNDELLVRVRDAGVVISEFVGPSH